jgi:hypothetical protein
MRKPTVPAAQLQQDAWGNRVSSDEVVSQLAAHLPRHHAALKLTIHHLQNTQNATLNGRLTSTPITQYPNPTDFFKQVRPDGYPEQEAAPAKSQPWRALWEGPQVSKDGTLLIACPKRCDWGNDLALPPSSCKQC